MDELYRKLYEGRFERKARTYGKGEHPVPYEPRDDQERGLKKGYFCCGAVEEDAPCTAGQQSKVERIGVERVD